MVSKSLLVLVMALGVAPLAMAQESPPAAGATVQSDQQDAARQNTSQSPLKPGNRNCLQSTGSLIPAKPGTCLPVAGRSYSQQDIRNTGSPTLGPALQQLDPSITVSGGH
ncbi:hypothetical protein SAMN04487785_105277 [Dyella jiangningensis]|uniref:hypothetical protein n=1 Tax=Dyella sp. AtDHG13 TaxID=1938897 RepID=UPI00088EE3AB|nr:hypothetical protein [Dyella sp. AtDHG13]PXV58164.1 hypothetical protein BDW41_10642 [Dyella sp. AtDHG13]SDK13402.1 hypothetical protein SAMN04487785_105277 [Dyella jiangningensis]